MKRTVIALLAVSLVAFILVDPALAAPGGKIARAAIESFWGRVVIALLVIFFLPLIVMSIWKERRAARRAQRGLAWLAQHSPLFRWIDLRERAIACFNRVHAAWRREDAHEAAAYMTDWYWQNQQLVYLDRWAAEGLVNHCDVKGITSMRPILVQATRPDEGFEGSKVVIEIGAKMQDYLARRDTGEVVEGDRKVKNVEALWTFTLNAGTWKLSNIEGVEMMEEYLRMGSELPRIEAQPAGRSRAG